MVAAATLALAAVGVVQWRSLTDERYGLPEEVSGFYRTCDGGSYPDAVAYAGPPPHPIVVFATYDQEFADFDRLRSESGLPAGWETATPDEVQLVACAVIVDREFAFDCGPYTNGAEYPAYNTTYEVTLYEPRTGRVVATVNLEGDTAAECPERFILFEGEAPGPWDSTVSGAQWTEALGRFVDR